MATRYRIRSSQAGKDGKQTVYRLTVPPEIARNLDPDQEYTVELTEEGIVYRPAVGEDGPQLPSWAKKPKRR
jgi:hypothetical protein